MAEHGYDLEVENKRVEFLLGEIPKPWHSEEVLRHLHHDLEMSLADIGRVFNRDRRTIQGIAKEFGLDVRYHSSKRKDVEEDQRTLDEYERDEDIEEMDGLGDLV